MNLPDLVYSSAFWAAARRVGAGSGQVHEDRLWFPAGQVDNLVGRITEEFLADHPALSPLAQQVLRDSFARLIHTTETPLTLRPLDFFPHRSQSSPTQDLLLLACHYRNVKHVEIGTTFLRLAGREEATVVEKIIDAYLVLLSYSNPAEDPLSESLKVRFTPLEIRQAVGSLIKYEQIRREQVDRATPQ